MHDNDKRNLTKAENKRTLKGDKKKKDDLAAESTNLLTRDQ
jgi:hypothetical protein